MKRRPFSVVGTTVPCTIAIDRLLPVLILWAIVVLSAANTFAGVQASIQYKISVSNPSAKVIDVSCRVAHHPEKALELNWAAWTPGYATVWNYGQFVNDLTARDGSGRHLAVRKHSVNQWIIESNNSGVVTFRYKVKAIDPAANLGFAQAYLDSVTGWFNGAALFPQIEGLRYERQSLNFSLPTGWKVATAMERDATGDTYEVPSYDVLVDSPVQLGRFLRRDIEVNGTKIGVVVAGCDSVDMDRLAGMVGKIVKCEFELMHGSPIDRYLFIYHAASRGAGGLEHLNATTISAPVAEFFKDDSWLKAATSHEFFHVWNAKRIHPAVFDVYDYSKPVHTKTVWFSEGLTAYYADVVLYRCGLMTKQALYGDLAHIIDLYENNPAHHWLSWQDISWNVWDPEVQQGLSVWLIPGWMIDLKMREVTDNRFSLDDVMRFMNIWCGDGGKGFGEDQIGMICGAVAQNDFRPFFHEYLDKANSFPYDSILSAAGLKWQVDSISSPDLGCKLWWTTATRPTWTTAGEVKIIGIINQGVACRAGLRDGDKVLSINGEKFVTRRALAEFERSLKPGDRMDFRLSRKGKEMRFRLVVGSRKIIHSTITEVESATEKQVEIRNGLLEGRTK